MDIKTYSIPTDEWNSGDDHYTCQNCGRDIRHAVSINGQVLGRNCAAKVLGWTKNGKALNSQFGRLANAIRALEATIASNKADRAEQSAFEIVQILGIPDPYHHFDCAGLDYAKKINQIAHWKGTES